MKELEKKSKSLFLYKNTKKNIIIIIIKYKKILPSYPKDLNTFPTKRTKNPIKLINEKITFNLNNSLFTR